jgi:hypothetical protein
VDCPVTSSPLGNAIRAGSDFVYLDHSTAAIGCVLRAEDAGSTAARSLSFTTTGDDNDYRVFDMNGLVGFAGGMMHLRCTIPTRDSAGNPSYIVGYLVDDDRHVDRPCGDSDYYSLAGAACRQIGSGGRVGYTTDGTIFNDLPPGGTNLVVDCPVPFYPSLDQLNTSPRASVW